MECRPLDLTIISAEDLKDVQLIGKQDLYAVVSINRDARTKQKTKVDKDCGTKPKWRHQMKLTVDDAAAREGRLSLVVEIVADRPIAGDKPVGEVSVPVKELLDQNEGGGGEEKTVTYAVKLPNGKAKGYLKFSFKFGEKYTFGGSSSGPGPLTLEHKSMDQPPVTAYPPGQGAPVAYPPGPSGYPPPGHDDKHGGGGVYGYPPPGGPAGYPPAGPGGYPPPGAYGGYPPAQQGGYPGYPPQGPGYGYPPQGPGYGYPPQGPYGYPQQQGYGGKPQKAKKHGGGGMGLGLGLGAGLLGGLLVGEAIDDIADMGGDFDF